MSYSYAQLEGLWIQAGGNASLAPVMAAIALAESSGNPNTVGPVGEKGLWQIYGKVWGPLATFDPMANARGAVHIEQVQGLQAWTTYNNGAYRRYLQGGVPPSNVPIAATPGATGATGVVGTGGPGAAAPPPTDDTCVLSLPLAGCIFNKSQARALIGGIVMAGGVVLLITGTVAVMQGLGLGRAVMNVVPMPGPMGMMAKAAGGKGKKLL